MKIFFILVQFVLLFLCSCTSCDRAREIEERRAALAQHDSDEYMQAQRDLYVADSISSFTQFELEEMKSAFVFEKNDKYQSKGYWVLPEQQGDKSKLDFFAEVEEEGKMLLVKIDADRHWSFHVVNLKDEDFLESVDVKAFVRRNLTDEEKGQIQKVRSLALLINKNNDAKASVKKNTMKVQYYQRKTAQ